MFTSEALLNFYGFKYNMRRVINWMYIFPVDCKK